MLARYIRHTREVSAVLTFVIRRLCRLLVTDAQSVRRQALDAVKKVRDGPKPVNRALPVHWLRAAVLEVAPRLRDAGLETLKTDPLIDPRKAPANAGNQGVNRPPPGSLL